VAGLVGDHPQDDQLEIPMVEEPPEAAAASHVTPVMSAEAVPAEALVFVVVKAKVAMHI